jgi:hypothetical protein
MLGKCSVCEKPFPFVRTEVAPIQGQSSGRGRLLVAMCPACLAAFSTILAAMASLRAAANRTSTTACWSRVD